MSVTPQEFNRLVIEKLCVGLKTLVSPAVLNSLDSRANVDAYTRHIEYALEMWLWSNTVKTEYQSVMRPATWWDWFKLEYFPKWLLRLRPVRYRQDTEVTKHIHICPHLNFETPRDQQFHLQWLASEGSLTRRAK